MLRQKQGIAGFSNALQAEGKDQDGSVIRTVPIKAAQMASFDAMGKEQTLPSEYALGTSNMQLLQAYQNPVGY